MRVKIVPNADGMTFRPFTSADECVVRSFGGYDASDPTVWTLDDWKAFRDSTGIKVFRPN